MNIDNIDPHLLAGKYKKWPFYGPRGYFNDNNRVSLYFKKLIWNVKFTGWCFTDLPSCESMITQFSFQEQGFRTSLSYRYFRWSPEREIPGYFHAQFDLECKKYDISLPVRPVIRANKINLLQKLTPMWILLRFFVQV